jgi:HEAT repeat protein
MDAGADLLVLDGGPAFVASLYGGEDRVLVRGVLDSAEARSPAQAARLGAQLMAVAKGEEKLAFESLLLERGSDAVVPLVELLEEGTDWQTAVQALDALGKLRAPEAVDAISVCLRDPNTWVRMAAAHALGNVAGPEAVGLLSGALADTADVVVTAALVGLGKTRDRGAMGPCAAQLGHPNPRVRGAAVSALGRLGGADATRLIRGMLDDPDAGVLHKARRALEMLTEDGA